MFSKMFLLASILAAALAVEVSNNVDDLKFYHYPSTGDRREIKYGDAGTLSSLKSGVQTVIIIDGFLSDYTSPMSQGVKNSLLGKSSNQNVIVLDWGKLSGSGQTLGNLLETASLYTKVLNNVGPVGGRLADFLNFLKTNKNIDPASVYIIGHSLGAHIGGAAGVFYKQSHSGVIGRITGLDPAGPFFSLQVNKDKRLHTGDATFVDIYHSNRGTLGDSDHQTGDINVYINGGDKQPGCEEADSSGFAGYCSHSFSWKLFDFTFTRDIIACPCSGLSCQCNTNCNTQCPNSILIGSKASTSSRGPYHLIITDPLSQY